MNSETLHIQFEKITDFLTGKTSASEKEEISAHLKTCKECENLRSRAENTINIMMEDRLEEVPAHILERTFDFLRERKTSLPTTEKSSLLKKITAVFTDQSSSLTPAFGLRSGQTDNKKRFWLSAEDAEIDLRLEKIVENWKVSGQVFGDFNGGKAVLQSQDELFETQLSELCEFTFSDVPSGVYRLFLYFEQTEIEIPVLNIE